MFPIIQFAGYSPKFGVPILNDLITMQLQDQDLGEMHPQNTNVFQCSSQTEMLITYKIIKHALEGPRMNYTYAIEVIK